MSESERFESMMLDHLYGLLEPEQVNELEAYLASGPAGAALRTQGEQWRRQLALAAKSEFPAVTFSPEKGAAAAAATVAPVKSPVSRTGAGRGRAERSAAVPWAPWVIGAAVVAVIVGFGLPLARNAAGIIDESRLAKARQAEYEKAEHEYNAYVLAYNSRKEAAQHEEQQAMHETEELENHFFAELEQAQKAINDKQFVVRLSGPARAQPGAPNEWRVEMYRRANGLAAQPGKVEWQVKDQKGDVVFNDAKSAPNKEGFAEPPTVNLPISFWEKVKSDSELTLEVIAYEGNLKSKVNARVPLESPVYVTQLATDKPLYKPGEPVYFRSLTLDRASFCPPEKDMRLEFRIKRPGGQPETVIDNGAPLVGSARLMDATAKDILGPDKKPLRGIGSGVFEIPPDAPGGEYELSVVDVTVGLNDLQNQITTKNAVLATRKFNVIKYVPENILKTLEFDGKSYGPGDTVSVKCTGTPVQGGKKRLGLRVAAQVDGKPVPVAHPAFTDAEGVVRLKFELPKDVKQGVGTLDVTFMDGSDSDVISRPIPLVGRVLHVEFFPEGGDLVAGQPNRVYFQATTPSGKPADLRGYVTDGQQIVAQVATLTDADQPGANRGQGSFTFTPAPGCTYFLKLKKPVGILEPTIKTGLAKALAGSVGASNLALGVGSLTAAVGTGYELPPVKADGIVLTALESVTNPGQPIRVSVRTGKQTRNVVVGAYVRGNLIDHRRVHLEAGQPAEVVLRPSSRAGGVTRVTVFEEKDAGEGQSARLVPAAERLVYLKPSEELKLSIHPNQTRYNPGSKVGLDINAVNEDGHPVPAIVMACVVNQNVLTMADEKTARLLPTHFLLASEVKHPSELEHADFLLSDDSKAGVALDLLLGTQGWRRFAEQSAAAPKAAANPDVETLLVANGQAAAPVETLRQEVEKVYASYLPKFEVASARLAEIQQVEENIEQQFLQVRAEAKRLADQSATARDRYQEALARVRQFDDDAAEQRTAYLARLTFGLLLIALVCLIAGLVRRREGGLGYLAAAAGCFILCAGALFSASFLSPEGQPTKGVAQHDEKLAEPEMFAAPQAAALLDEAQKAEGVTKFDADAKEEKAGDAKKSGAVNRPHAMAANGLARGVNQPPARNRQKEVADLPGLMPAPGQGFGSFLKAAKAPELRFGGMGFRMAAGPAAAGLAWGAPAADKDAARLARPEVEQLEKQVRFAQRKKKDLFFQPEGLRREELGLGVERIDGKRRALRDRAGGIAGEFDNEKAGRQFFFQAAKGANAQAAGDILDDANIELSLIQLNQAPGFFVREFKFEKAAAENGQRTDFTETVCWQPALVLPESGRMDLHFQLSDSIARYQVLVAGHTLDGRLGATVMPIEARKPFTVDPKVPFEITANDRIDVPVRVVNDSDIHRAVNFNIIPQGLTTVDPQMKLGQGSLRLELTANEKGRQIISFRSAKKEGEVGLRVEGTSDPFEAPDEVVRNFKVVSDGFPVNGAASDLLEKQANATLNLPELLKGTLKVQLQVYPTTLADLQKGLDSLLREPGGCFEQTSTSNYPNLLILGYLKSCDQAKPELVQRAKEMLDRGYAKLVSFECPDSGTNNTRHGFEWFGQMDQQHQALTAYGLLQFKDLDRAYPGKVDPELIKRTQKYLLAQQKPGCQGFKRNERALDTFGRAPDHITDAYIVWALAESDPDDKEGMTDLNKQLDYLKKLAGQHPEGKNDPYFLALVANALLHRPGAGNREEAVAILARIADNHTKEGPVTGARTSITCSGGRDLEIETTALALLGWLRSGEPAKFIKPVKESSKWIGQQRGGYGGFGSTQSTILALKALIEHTKASRKPAEAGEIRLIVNGKTFTKAFTKDDLEVITLDVDKPEEIFKAGVTEARVEITAKQAYPFTLSWSGYTVVPLSSEKRLLDLETTLERQKASEGDTVRVNVAVSNRLDAGHGMAVAIIGLPGGCRLPADLKEMTKLREDGKISFFEIKGRELVLYWRSIKPKEKVELSFNAICDIPGQYTGPASRAYLYYNADHRHWVNPLTLEITPSKQAADTDLVSR